MNFLRSLLKRFKDREIDAEIKEEIQFHIDMRTEANLATGMPVETARSDAVDRFGDPEQIRREGSVILQAEARRRHLAHFMADLVQDLRFSFRLFSKKPAFALIAVLTLALGIGANTAIFSLIQAIVLQPLPMEEAERLVFLRDVFPNRGTYVDHSFPEFDDWSMQRHIFDDFMVYTYATANPTGVEVPEELVVIRSTANFLKLLAEDPVQGRFFSANEETIDNEPVALISHSLWQRRFGGDPQILGRILNLGGKMTTLIGVVPPGTAQKLPTSTVEVDIWEPIRVTPAENRRGSHRFFFLGRLREGLEIESARQEVALVAQKLAQEGISRHTLQVTPLQEFG